MINKKVEAEFAVGIILILAMIMGGLIWLNMNNQHASSPIVRDKVDVKPSDKVVFLGDSITAIENWNALLGVSYVANAGISGDTTDDVLGRLDAAIAHKPRKLFLMIGVNDLLKNREVDYIFKNYETILSRIKTQSPDTIIYLQSVLPVDKNVLKMEGFDEQKVLALNEKIKSLVDGKNVIFIDLYASFCGNNNKIYRKYTVDGLHLSAAGYAVWKNLIASYVRI